MKFHDELNPLLWTDKKLHSDVREHLLELTDAFIEYMEIPEDSVIDVLLLGSEASYNYTDKSDLDVHIKVDYNKIHENCPIVEGYLWALKSLFNSQHDITIHNIPVEVYAENSEKETNSNGIYSLQNNEWIKEPQKIPPTDNDSAVEAKVKEIEEAANNIFDTDDAQNLLDKIYEMRQSGLEEEGEFSVENLSFKKLRDDGILDKLKQIKIDDFDERVSLDKQYFNENKDILLASELDDILQHNIFKYINDDEDELDNKFKFEGILSGIGGNCYVIKSIDNNGRYFEFEFGIYNTILFITDKFNFEYNFMTIIDQKTEKALVHFDLTPSNRLIKSKQHVWYFISNKALRFDIKNNEYLTKLVAKEFKKKIKKNEKINVTVKLW